MRLISGILKFSIVTVTFVAAICSISFPFFYNYLSNSMPEIYNYSILLLTFTIFLIIIISAWSVYRFLLKPIINLGTGIFTDYRQPHSISMLVSIFVTMLLSNFPLLISSRIFSYFRDLSKLFADTMRYNGRSFLNCDLVSESAICRERSSEYISYAYDRIVSSFSSFIGSDFVIS